MAANDLAASFAQKSFEFERVAQASRNHWVNLSLSFIFLRVIAPILRIETRPILGEWHMICRELKQAERLPQATTTGPEG
jgi:hypothetical protein